MSMTIASFLWLAAVAACAIYAIAVFNRLVALRRRCDQAGSDIDVQLKQRFDLIPNLVETVKGYAGHERGTLESVILARNAAHAAASPQAQMQAETALAGALSRLMMVAEAYPQLKASETFAVLQAELADVENKIAAARRFLNGAVTEFNTTREQFPANVLAGLFGVGPVTSVYDPGVDGRKELEKAPAIQFGRT
jgi:LemA protein